MFKKKSLKPAVPAPNRVCLKSPQFYLQCINKILPAWGRVLATKAITSTRVWVALWAGAVAVANACRISEVLGMKGCMVLPHGMAVILGAKGSNARMICTGLEPSDCEYLRVECAHRPVFSVEYLEVWRAVVGHGLAVQEPGHQHQSVTHQGRYSLAAQIAPNLGEVVAGQALGHKSSKSARYYAHPEQCAEDRRQRNAIRKRKELFTQGPQLPAFLGGTNDA